MPRVQLIGASQHNYSGSYNISHEERAFRLERVCIVPHILCGGQRDFCPIWHISTAKLDEGRTQKGPGDASLDGYELGSGSKSTTARYCSLFLAGLLILQDHVIHRAQ